VEALLNVLAAEAGQALHVLDRFHIAQHMNQAVDEVRRAESTRLRASSKEEAKHLKFMGLKPHAPSEIFYLQL
jgi:transposase